MINIQASAEHLFKRMCDTLGANEIYENGDYSSNEKRTNLRDQINAEIAEIQSMLNLQLEGDTSSDFSKNLFEQFRQKKGGD